MRTTQRLFHGTETARVDSLRKTGFHFESGAHLSFGDGVYFYIDPAKAERFARERFRDNGSVVVVDIPILPEHLKKMTFYELENWPGALNERAAKEDWHVIDASCDDGIFVVRPIAVKDIVIIDVWPVSEGNDDNG